ncbi:circadian clock KaiB family protein [Falsiroseomonas selenitidurans]|uniref:Circadian clock protein KaiB n=1 Tax=Falsiroseomonas selenitidurans TaxID=2716335 RepID=A0ABX1E5V0_9PROT|nr:circadian clock KaiB family protein [Falsiroseomonas selenitidurans]NKC32158.1 circadian clock protein KaiB [Falsiroseomonas selenitidurans]
MPDTMLRLRLYVAGASPNSRRARANLAHIRAAHGRDWEVETVDVFAQPARALADGILLTPQLLILDAEGPRAVVGDLGDHAALLATLGVVPP